MYSSTKCIELQFTSFQFSQDSLSLIFIFSVCDDIQHKLVSFSMQDKISLIVLYKVYSVDLKDKCKWENTAYYKLNLCFSIFFHPIKINY